MTLKEINYSPLQKIDGAWNTVIKETLKIPALLFLALMVVLSVGGFFLIGEFIFFVVILIAAWIGNKVARYKNTVWKEFAAVNGWAVTPSGMNAGARWIPPALMNIGSGRKVGDIIHAEFEGHSCSLYPYEFSTGSGKSRQHHYYTIAWIALARPFPHLILDSKHSWTLTQRGSASTKIKLEGNFNEHFSLYFSKGEHIDALSVITPDVMQTLIARNKAQDIEIIGQNMYFLVGHDSRSMAKLPLLLGSVDALADEIAHKAKTIRYQNGTPNNTAILAETAAAYHQSGDKVVSTVVIVAIVIFLLPALMFILIGGLSAFMST